MRSAEPPKQFGNSGEQVIERGPARLACHAFLFPSRRIPDGQLRWPLAISRAVFLHAPRELLAQTVRAPPDPVRPVGACGAAFGAGRPPCAEQIGRNNNWRGRPAQTLAGSGDLLLAGAIAVRLLRACNGRESEPDGGPACDHIGWSVTERAVTIAVLIASVPCPSISSTCHPEA